MGKLEVISEAEAANNLDQCLERVIDQGDSFHIVLASGFKVYLGPPHEEVAPAGRVAGDPEPTVPA